MGDGDHQPAAGHQNAGGLGHRLFHMVDVLQAHEGHGTVRGGVGHRQRGGITGSHPPGSAGSGGGGRDHRRRGVDPEDPVTEPGQVTRESAFPASDVQS